MEIKKVRVTAYLTPELARRIRVFAAEEGQQLSDVFRLALEAYLDSKRPKP